MMRSSTLEAPAIAARSLSSSGASGFSLVELLLGALLVLLLGAPLFRLLNEVQLTAAGWRETQEVLENTRAALNTVTRSLRQAGNDPHRVGFEGITIVSSTEVRLRSDLTGAAGSGGGNKGDPDGDTDDSWEDIIIRYDAAADTVTIVHKGGVAQTIAQGISDFSVQFFDDLGATHVGARARKALVSITGTNTAAPPKDRIPFAMTLNCYVQLREQGI